MSEHRAKTTSDTPWTAHQREKYLKDVLQSHENHRGPDGDLENSPDPRLKKLHDILSDLKESLKIRFKGKLNDSVIYREDAHDPRIYSLVESGSMAKKTDINVKSDMDLVLVFKKTDPKKSLPLLERIHKEVIQFLRAKYPSSRVRQQSVSIGITLIEKVDYSTTDQRLIEFKIDVVPAEIMNPNIWQLNLFVTPSFAKDLRGNLQPTNIQKHIDSISSDENRVVRELVRLLKIFYYHQHVSISSFLLELLVLDFKKQVNEQVGKSDLHVGFLEILHHIRSHLHYPEDSISASKANRENSNYPKRIHLIDPGNPKNVVSDLLREGERGYIAKVTGNWLDLLRIHPEVLETMIPMALISEVPPKETLMPHNECHESVACQPVVHYPHNPDWHLHQVDVAADTRHDDYSQQRWAEGQAIIWNALGLGKASPNPDTFINGGGSTWLSTGSNSLIATDIKYSLERDIWILANQLVAFSPLKDEVSNLCELRKALILILERACLNTDWVIIPRNTHLQLRRKLPSKVGRQCIRIFVYNKRTKLGTSIWNEYAHDECFTSAWEINDLLRRHPLAAQAVRLIRLMGVKFGHLLPIHLMERIAIATEPRFYTELQSMPEFVAEIFRQFLHHRRYSAYMDPLDSRLDWAHDTSESEWQASYLIIQQYLTLWHQSTPEDKYSLIQKFFPYQLHKP